jgi:hypothetical protein
MASKKPTPQLRRHPIPLGRGGKWWHEQVRRNVRAIFDGLVRKGAPADRATMSRAYAFAIGSLVRYGYLKRHAKGGLYVTEKGLAKSREKLRTPDAKKKHAAYERQLALVRKPRRRRNPEDPAELARRRVAARSREPRELFPDDVEARTHYMVFLVDPMEIIEPYIAMQQGRADASLTAAVRAYVYNHADEVNAALRAHATKTPYFRPSPPEEVAPAAAPAPRRRLVPRLASLTPEPEPAPVEIRTGLRQSRPVSFEEEYGFSGTMSEAMTEAGVADAAAKAAKRRAARDLLNERREVMSRQGMNRPQMMSSFDPATGMTTWSMMIPFMKRRTGADVTISRIRSEVARAAGYPEGDERITVRTLTIPQIADTDILRAQFPNEQARLAEATRLFQTIHSRGISLIALPRMKGWTKIGTDKATRATYYETQAPTAVAWAIANVAPEMAPGTASPLPQQLMQTIARVGGTMTAEKIAQRQREATQKREKQALRLAITGRRMVDPEMQARTAEERKKLIELDVTKAMAERGYISGKKAEKRIARVAREAQAITGEASSEEEVYIPRRSERMRGAAPADEPMIPRRGKTPPAPSESVFVEIEEVYIPRRADRMKKPPQTNPFRRR